MNKANKKRMIYVLVGPPGCGKSTWASHKRATVFSSDEYRMNMFGKLEQTQNGLVFETLKRDMRDFLKSNPTKNVVFDATNLARKRRMHFYREFRSYGHITIVYFLNPFELLLERNEEREEDKQVPESVIWRMYLSQEIPRKGVDCDEVIIEGDYQGLSNAIKSMTEVDLPHNSPYHKETLLEHIVDCVKIANCKYPREINDDDNYIFTQLGYMHDIGKFIAQFQNDKQTSAAKYFRDKNNGVFTQYMFHANVSANLTMAHFKDNKMMGPMCRDKSWIILECIFQHMRAHDGFSHKYIEDNKFTAKELFYMYEFAKIDALASSPDYEILVEYKRLQEEDKTLRKTCNMGG